MNDLQRGVINIIQSALTGECLSLPKSFNFSNAVKIAKKHKIECLFYYGALNCGFKQEEPLMQELFTLVCGNIAVSEQQIYAIKEIFSAFDKEKIDYLPIKGVLLKQLYPKPEMRSMSDLDILIRYEEYSEKIIPVMNSLGFTEGRVSDNELVWNKPMISIELHRRLIPSYNKDYYAYYGDGWRLAKLSGGTRYSMTNEEQLIYLFTHFAKHYRDSGIGIRHMVDLWVFKKHYKNLDDKYIEAELQKLQLYNFYENIINTLNVWFEQKENNEVSDFITGIIFNSGVFGTNQAHVLSDALKLSKTKEQQKNIKKAKLISEIFPSYSFMKRRYPILDHNSWLLPALWLVRLADAVLFRRKNVGDKFSEIKLIDDKSVADYREALNYVGLDFNFKE